MEYASEACWGLWHLVLWRLCTTSASLSYLLQYLDEIRREEEERDQHCGSELGQSLRSIIARPLLTSTLLAVALCPQPGLTWSLKYAISGPIIVDCQARTTGLPLQRLTITAVDELCSAVPCCVGLVRSESTEHVAYCVRNWWSHVRHHCDQAEPPLPSCAFTDKSAAIRAGLR